MSNTIEVNNVVALASAYQLLSETVFAVRKTGTLGDVDKGFVDTLVSDSFNRHASHLNIPVKGDTE